MAKQIRDKDGNVIQTSKNLAGIRRYVRKHLIKIIQMDKLRDGSGMLSILFRDGASFQTPFASYSVLKAVVARWRNVRGAKVVTFGEDAR
jgi:hypothetical protein